MNPELKAAIDQQNRDEAIGLIQEIKPKITEGEVDTSEAEEIMIYILDKARREAFENYEKRRRDKITLDEYERKTFLDNYTDMLRALFEQFPTMNVNKQHKYGPEKSGTSAPSSLVAFRDRALPFVINVKLIDASNEVNLAIFRSGVGYGSPGRPEFSVNYSAVSPLLLSMFYDMSPIMDLLLADSRIDTSIGDVLVRDAWGKKEIRSCYDWASGINADTGMGIGQYGRWDPMDRWGESSNGPKKIVVHFLLKNKAGIQLPTRFSASEIREFLFKTIMKSVHAEKTPEGQLSMLKNAIAGSDSIPSDSALWAFLNTKGLLSSKTEKEKLDDSLMAEVAKIVAKRTAPADPTTVPLKTAFSSASLNADPVEPEGQREKSSSSYFGNKEK